MKMKARAISILSVLAVFAAFRAAAATTYEIDNVVDLVDAVGKAGDYDTIILMRSGSPYELGMVPCMSPVGHLYSTKRIILRGETGNPNDVVLVGTTNRILYVSSPNPVIRDLTFSNGNSCGNTVREVAPEDERDSGAICLRYDHGTALVSNCVFVANRSVKGGAVGNYYSNKKTRYAGTLMDCVFRNNSSTGNGGAVHGIDKMISCTFEDNEATGSDSCGGAAWQVRTARGCTFLRNMAKHGGAISWTETTGTAEFTVDDCTFRLNSATHRGGALYEVNGSAFVTNCTFEGNVAYSSYEYPGGGALANVKQQGAWDCTFITNSSVYGGSVYDSVVHNSRFTLSTTDSQSGILSHTAIIYDSQITLLGGSGVVVGSDSKLYGCSFSGRHNDCLGLNCWLYDCIFTNLITKVTTSSSGTFKNSILVGGLYSPVSKAETSKPVFLDCTLDRCRLVNIRDEGDSGNVNMLFGQKTSLTNCLVTGCSGYVYYNSALGAGFYNCTVVSNDFFGGWKAGGSCQRVAIMENTFFFDNKYTGTLTYEDDSNARYVVDQFNFCILKAWGSDWRGEGNLNIYNTDFSPGFVGAIDLANPFALRRNSPAHKKGGRPAAWMADSTDLRGEGYPRLRDNRVDIGCYQCWLDPEGMVLFVR